MNQDLIYLASTSPRRRQLLSQIGIPHRVHPVPVDETPLSGEAPESLVIRLAKSKAAAARETLGDDAYVLAADTVVVLGERVLSKPADKAEGLAMLAALSGKEHLVMTGVCLIGPAGQGTRLNVSRVRFRELTKVECLAYWDTGEPADKAGGYAVQGLASQFVTQISGSYSSIMGLPLYETAELLREAGLDLLQPEILEAAS